LTEVRQELGTEQPQRLASVFFTRLILHAPMKPELPCLVSFMPLAVWFSGRRPAWWISSQ